MCNSCLCDAAMFEPELYLGEPPRKFEEFNEDSLAWNDYLYGKTSLYIEVALKEYEDIQKGAILFVFVNDPSFVFNKMPPKGTSGNVEGKYLSPGEQVSFYKNAKTDDEKYCSDEDEKLLEDYIDYIESEIKNGSVYDISQLFKVLEIEKVNQVDYLDFIYDKLVEAAKLIDSKSYTLPEPDEEEK